MGSLDSMKTKIIYISGAEVFDMADIRAAFDEVRNTLGLKNDTVLFGVPVDLENSLESNNHAENTASDTDIQNTDEPATEIIEPITDETTDTAPIIAPQPKKTTRGRPKKKADVESEPVAESEPEPVVADTEEKVIPILSVLASKQADVQDTPADVSVADAIVTESETTVEFAPQVSEQETISEINISAEISAPVAADEMDDVEPQHVTIEDMITDDAPSAPIEKTLEQLLESMTPLREDHNTDEQNTAEEEFTAPETFESDTTDATLEQLAAEFAEKEDTIVTPTKSVNQGKIGKLKNILPFKKVKRDDTGLMGDLFGWAGIAANDEDFSMPEFFTTGTAKK